MSIFRPVVLNNGTQEQLPVDDDLSVGAGIDASMAGNLTIGSATATSVTVGNLSINTDFPGSVGIKTSAPAAYLDVRSTVGNTNLVFSAGVAVGDIDPNISYLYDGTISVFSAVNFCAGVKNTALSVLAEDSNEDGIFQTGFAVASYSDHAVGSKGNDGILIFSSNTSSGDVSWQQGIELYSSTNSSHTGNVGWLGGAYVDAYHGGSGTSDFTNGIYISCFHNGTGVSSENVGLYASSGNGSDSVDPTHRAIQAFVGNFGSGTITDASGVFVNTITAGTSGGTVTNGYGVYIQAQNQAGTDYGLYFDAPNPIVMTGLHHSGTGPEGSLGVGTSAPSSVLHVDSNAANTDPIITIENTSGNFQVFRVDATPEGAVTGSVGDLANDTTNGALYIKTSGAGTDTGWSALGSGGGISGTGANNQVAVWSGTSTQDGSAGLTFDGTSLSVDTPVTSDYHYTQFIGSSLSTAATVYECFAVDTNISNQSTGTIVLAKGFNANVRNSSTGTINTLAGFNAFVGNFGAGTVGDAAGFWVERVGNTGGGTLTNGYGVYIDSTQIGGTNKWAVYANAANPTVITTTGAIGAGVSAPNSVLHVDSNAGNTDPIITIENTSGNFQVFRVDATPEGAVTGSVGDLANDTVNGVLYIKASGTATNTGWQSVGTGSAGVQTLTSAPTVTIDTAPTLPSYKEVTLNQNTSFITANLGAGRNASVKVVCDATARSLSFPGWTWLGQGAPTSIPANATGYLSIVSFGSTDAEVVAAWAQEDQPVAGTTLPITTVSAATTLDSTNYTVLCDTSGGAFSVTLPAAAASTGRIYNVKNISTNPATVQANGAETIDGANTYPLAAQWQTVSIQSNGVAWFVI